MPYGFKVSLPDKDVSSDNPQDFVYDSTKGSVKVVQQPSNKTYQTVTVAGSSSETVTIAHNLGFVPVCMVFVELTPNSGRWYGGVAYPAPIDSLIGTVLLNTLTDGTKADITNLYLVFTNQSASQQTVKYYYYIFGDSGI